MHVYVVVISLALFFLSLVIGDNERVQEMNFKFWLQPGREECYHQLLEPGSSLYLMYEILNTQSSEASVLVYLRNAYNGSIVALSKAVERAHLELATNETTLIDICLDHVDSSESSAKYIALFLHVYHVEKIATRLQEVELLNNVTMNARAVFNVMTNRLILSRVSQMEIEMMNQRDVYLIEQILHWIDRWAMLHSSMIVSCCLLQTLFIKRLFHTPPQTRFQ